MSRTSILLGYGLTLACGPSAGDAEMEGDATSSSATSSGSDGAESGTGEAFAACIPDIVEGYDPIDEADCDTFFVTSVPKLPPGLEVRIVNARAQPITLLQRRTLRWVDVEGVVGGRQLELFAGCRGMEPHPCDSVRGVDYSCDAIDVHPGTQRLAAGTSFATAWDRAMFSAVTLPPQCHPDVGPDVIECQVLMYAAAGSYEVRAEAYDGDCTTAEEGCSTLTASATWDGLCDTLELVFE